MAGEERALAGAGEEAQVLRLALVGDGQPGLARELAHLRLVQLAEREAQPRERCGRQRGEHVALVLGRVGRGAQQPVGASRARSGRWRARPRRARSAKASIASSRTSPLQRTHGFGVSPAAWSARNGATTPARERRAQVEREVRQAHPVRDGAREPHGVRRAARGLRVVGRVAPQLERHRDRLAARARDEQRGDGGVDAAAHRDERPAGDPPRRAPRRATAAPSATCSASAASSAACSLPGESPPSSAATSRRADPRRVEQRRAVRRARRPPSRRRSPRRSPDASKPASTTRSPSTRRSIRTRSPQAAPPARARERLRGHVAAPPGKLQVLCEGLGVHAPSVGPATSCAARP